MTLLRVLLGNVAYFALLLYFFIMWARFVLELMRSVNPNWRPNRAGLVAAEIVFTVTDPPIKFFRKLLPPMRFGQVALDFGWSITMLGVIVAMTIANVVRSGV